MWAEALAGAKVCVCVYTHVHVGRCVGADKRKGLQLKEGGEILSGKAGRRMVTDMAGNSCRWEEQYDGRLVLRYKDSLQMSSQPLKLLIDQWECVLVLLYSLLGYEVSNSRSMQKAFPKKLLVKASTKKRSYTTAVIAKNRIAL